METKTSQFNRWLVVVLFAVAMAWNESAVVLYLRTLANRLEPYQPEPLPLVAGLACAELGRELATIVMLATVGWLAGRCVRSRFGYFLIGFGVWDIFYYVFLRPMTHWPNSLLDWDLLFLVPLPWWGPVLAPALIALLMVAFGTMATQSGGDAAPWPGWRTGVAAGLGILLALYVFMTDALLVAHQGAEAWRRVLPEHFNWPLFLVALALMAAPVTEMARQLLCRRASSQISLGDAPEGA